MGNDKLDKRPHDNPGGHSPEESKPGELQQQLKTSSQLRAFISREHSGPLPAPEDMERYEGVLSGAAERIFRKFEEQASHRMEIEKAALNADIQAQQTHLLIVANRENSAARSDLFGQTLGALIALGAIGGAIYLGFAGQTGAAVALCSIPLVSIIQAMRTRKPG